MVDIVAAITDSPTPRKYWSVLKTRLKKAGNELTTRCSQLKMTAADGKRYATDCFAQDDIIKVVRVIPSPKTSAFLDWFIYLQTARVCAPSITWRWSRRRAVHSWVSCASG